MKVEAKVVGHERGPKLHVLKFKPKRGYKRRTGHRQDLTRIEVTDDQDRRARGRPQAGGEGRRGRRARGEEAARAQAGREEGGRGRGARKRPAAGRRRAPAKKKEDSDGA